MSTKKNSVFIATAQIGWFPLCTILPMRCVNEIIGSYADLLCLFRFASKKLRHGIAFLENLAGFIRTHEPFDLADVDVKTQDAKVRIRLLLR